MSDIVNPTDTQRTVTIQNSKGLHARAAAKFVRTLEEFDQAEVRVSKGNVEVSGRSIMGLMMLTASIGTQLIIKAKGAKAEQALDALEDLIGKKFYEEK